MGKQTTNGFYRVNIGMRQYRIFIKDLKMLKKLKKKVTPPLPQYDKDNYQVPLKRCLSTHTEPGSELSA